MWIARPTEALLWLAARAPRWCYRTLAALLGLLASWVPNELKAISELNLKICFPDLAAARRRELVRRSLQSIATQVLELGPLWSWPLDKLESLEAGVERDELLIEALETGKGVLLLTPHLGNWEALNHVLMRYGRLVSLYRSPRVAELDMVVRRGRERTGCEMAPGTHGGIRKVLHTLRGGGMVLVLPDQEPLEENGVFAPFFGVPALTMTLVGQLLRRTSAVPLFVVAERQRDGRFMIRFLEAPPGVSDADDVAAATALNLGVERCVRLCPEQYLWSYKRFKTSPPGDVTPYRAIWSRRRKRRNRVAANAAGGRDTES